MRRALGRAARILAVPTLAVGFVFAFVPGRAEVAVRVYALVVAAVVLGLFVGGLRRAYPRETPARPAGSRAGGRRSVPPTLGRLEQEIALGVAGTFDLHHRLRPRLRALASGLLAASRGVDLDRDPERARRALGDEAWDLTRSDRPAPTDRLARGIPIRDLDRVVESLERL
jgi:hypothetical protein